MMGSGASVSEIITYCTPVCTLNELNLSIHTSDFILTYYLCLKLLSFLFPVSDFILAYEEKTELRADYAEERKKALSRKKYLMGLLRAGVEMERVR